MAQFNLDNYIDVQDRINTFWSEYPQGAIRTRLMSPPDDFSQCRYEAAVFKDSASAYPDATGYAFEIAGQGNVNRTSHEENCETSAIGRALSNMGYAKTAQDRPSRQEMGKVVRMQGNPQTHEEADRLAAADDRRVHSVEEKPRPTIANPDAAASEKQMDWIRGLAKNSGFGNEDGHLDEAKLFEVLERQFGVVWPNVTKGQASQLIDAFKARQVAPF